MQAGQIDEFELIDRLVARLGPLGADVLAGPGDDVAALDLGGERLLLATCDAQVAGVHFEPGRCDARRLGRKCAAVNLSDIAAAGGRPTHFLVSLIVPAATEVGFLEGLYDGLAEEARRFGADVVGGNVSTGAQLAVDILLLGEARRSELLRRDGARSGDAVLVTGRLGGAAAGRHLVAHPQVAVESRVADEARDAFETPIPRIVAARALVAAGGVSAAIDVSDGLAADVGHLCDRSGVGVRLLAAAIPVARSARAVAAATDLDALALALAGGEDYELVFTAPRARVAALGEAVARAGTEATVVGEIVDAPAGRWLVDADGRERPLDPVGWRHFDTRR